MQLRSYATPADFADFTGAPEWDEAADPAETRLMLANLVRASGEVDGLLLTARYQTDENGIPVDEKIKTALAAATCAIAEDYEENGGVNASGYQSGGLLSASFSLKAGASDGSAPPEKTGALEALRILRTAGLIRVGIAG